MDNELIFPAGKSWIGIQNAKRDDLINVRIPDGIVSIARHAFDGCVSLKRIVFPDAASEDHS